MTLRYLANTIINRIAAYKQIRGQPLMFWGSGGENQEKKIRRPFSEKKKKSQMPSSRENNLRFPSTGEKIGEASADH